MRLIVARPRRRIGNVPAEATSFVGRRRELAEIRKTLADARLVSLVGPGGVGKTRLAVRIATDLRRGFADGAWWVELAEIRDAALVTNAVVAALDLRDLAATNPLQILLSHLRDSELLLVLDNCEHVLEASAHLVAEVLRAAPNVRVMTTTREPLQVQGEHVVPVPPLGLPPAGGGEPLSQLRQNEAVLLFTDRAAAASGTFELTSSNQAAVVQLCRRLDGLPLAIELAAVRTRVLTAEQILDRLTDRFALLTGGGRAALPRQQTLRTTIDWSHDLLTAAEQTLLRRLCVFAGRFTVDDAEAVCAYGEGMAGQALDVLSALVDKSLVMKEDVRGVACYRLHETMREYASLKLRDAAEEEALDESFVEYYRMRCLEAEDDARHRTLEWLQWVELEIDNIRSALQKCLATSDWRRGLELATSIGYYWVTRGTTESMRWFDRTARGCCRVCRCPSPGVSLSGLAEHAAGRSRGCPAMACSSDLVSPGSGAALAAVRIAVDGRYGGEHGGRSRGCPTAPRRSRGPHPRPFSLSRVDRPDPGEGHPCVLRGRPRHRQGDFRRRRAAQPGGR